MAAYLRGLSYVRTIAVALLCVSYAAVAQRESRSVPLVSFAGSGQESIEAMVADAQGNIYIAGTTTSPDFPVVAAWQPQIGESAVMRSSDSGATWTKLTTPSAGLQTIQPDPLNAKILFAASSTAIYKSTDAGLSWRIVYAWTARLGLTRSVGMVVDPGNTRRLAAATPTGFLVSLDGGETWMPPGSQPPTCFSTQQIATQVAVDPLGSGTMTLGGIYGLCVSRDWGVTFQGANPAEPGGGGIIAAFDLWHPGWIYAAVNHGTQGFLYLSTDSGRTWTQRTAPPSVYFTDVAFLSADPDQPNAWYATTGEGALWRSPRRHGELDPTATHLIADRIAGWRPQHGRAQPCLRPWRRAIRHWRIIIIYARVRSGVVQPGFWRHLTHIPVRARE